MGNWYIVVNWNLLAIIIMPDISMCRSNTCPIKDSCYRFTAVPSTFRQSYADFKYNEETKNCNYYWRNEDQTGKDRRVDVTQEAKRTRD